jgi:hypothetical protein
MVEYIILTILGIGVILGSLRGLKTERFNRESILMNRIGLVGGIAMFIAGVVLIWYASLQD